LSEQPALTPFEAYGEAARRVADPTVATARYPFQGEGARAIVPEIVAKLGLRSEHRLLEIGFGTGSLITRLAEHAGEVLGIDHPACVSRLEKAVPGNVSLIAGKWPEARPPGSFHRIVAYSVLQYLPDGSTAERFIEACVDALAEDGVAMIGDLPNEDAKRRLRASAGGQEFEAEWSRRVAQSEQDDPDVAALHEIFTRVTRAEPFIDDGFVLDTLRRYRDRGYEAYVVPQGRELPFSYTREDILIRRRS
jgi:cyclopropane fatty-acyl-phospholipid synthase-like methyltransferase